MNDKCFPVGDGFADFKEKRYFVAMAEENRIPVSLVGDFGQKERSTPTTVFGKTTRTENCSVVRTFLGPLKPGGKKSSIGKSTERGGVAFGTSRGKNKFFLKYIHPLYCWRIIF